MVYIIDFCANVPDWSRTDDSRIHLFQNELNLALKCIKIPVIIDVDGSTVNYKIIEDDYECVTFCTRTACFRTVPQKTVLSYSDYVAPGCNEYVKDKNIVGLGVLSLIGYRSVDLDVDLLFTDAANSCTVQTIFTSSHLLTTLTLHHTFTVSFQAQISPFPQIFSTIVC